MLLCNDISTIVTNFGIARLCPRTCHFYRCQCGKCSLFGIINNTCPLGYFEASSMIVFAGVYTAIAANNGFIPDDHGSGALLLPKLATNLVGGHAAQVQSHLISQRVEWEKIGLVLQAMDRQSARAKPSPRSELDLNRVSEKSLRCSAQIIHTARCTQICSTLLHSLKTVTKFYLAVVDACVLTVTFTASLLEHLSIIQHLVHDLSAALTMLLLISMSGVVEINPRPTGK